MAGKEMKGKQRKKEKNPLFIIILATLILIQFPIKTGGAADQIDISFDPCPNEPPDRPINIYPQDNEVDIDIPVSLQVLVYDNTSNTVDVYFHNASNDSLIGIDYNLSGSGDISTFIWSGLKIGLVYEWYAVAKDGQYENTSETWNFTTRSNRAPSIHNNEYPTNTSTNIEMQITCNIQVSDEEADPMNIYWYENSGGSWVLRQINSSINNGTHYWTFLQVTSYSTTYYWKVIVNDSIQNTSAIFHFTTQAKPSSPSSPSFSPGAPPKNYHPFAKITGPQMGYTNETLKFYSYYSYDPDGIITNYTWNFGDNYTSDQKNPEYLYAKPGNYTITLKVTDNDNLSNYTVTTVSIRDKDAPKKTDEPEEKRIQLLCLPMVLIAAIIATIIILGILSRQRKRNDEVKKSVKKKTFPSKTKKKSINNKVKKEKPTPKSKKAHTR